MAIWLVARDVLLFFVGLAGTIHEVFLNDLDRPAIATLLAGLLGLPLFLRKDEKGK